jgi:hypothetical protein
MFQVCNFFLKSKKLVDLGILVIGGTMLVKEKEKRLCIEPNPIWNHTHLGMFLKNLKLGVLKCEE